MVHRRHPGCDCALGRRRHHRAAVGAGGLGEYIFRGLAMVNNQVILAGAIPAAPLAMLADTGLGWLERLAPR